MCFEEANLLQPQPDRLDYLFSEHENGKSLLEKASKEFPRNNLPNSLNNNLTLKTGLLRLTKDAVLNIKTWSAFIQKKVWSLTAELPRFLKVERKAIPR